MKKLSIVLATAALPFLLVWAAFILTGFSFNPREIFQAGVFWGVSAIYWFLWICLAPLLVEVINDVVNSNKKKQPEKVYHVMPS